jgi:hypothetical protein
MTLRRIALTASFLSTVGMAALPVVASARFPKPKSYLVVPGKSIGGAKIGGSFSAAIAAWGGRRGTSVCSTVIGVCQWDGSPPLQRAVLTARGVPRRGGGVTLNNLGSISLQTDGKSVGRGSLTKFKDKYKIGIGSPARELCKRYGKRLYSIRESASGILQLGTNPKTATVWTINGRFLPSGKMTGNIMEIEMGNGDVTNGPPGKACSSIR